MTNPEAVEEVELEIAETLSTEESEIPMSTHERAIKDFLEEGVELPPESKSLLLRKLWESEPYKSIGFVLEGFPDSADDVAWLAESNLYFDFVVGMIADVDEVVPRLLPVRLAKWRARMAKLEANKRIKAEWNKAKRERLKEARRMEILNKITIKRDAKMVGNQIYAKVSCIYRVA